MPKWVADHATWEKAKAAALKNYDESDKNFYAIVASIYEKMGGKVEHHETKGAAFELSDDVVRASATTEVSQARDDVMAGDYPGHPFRGNQYAEGEGEGGEHNVASSRAHAHSMAARTSAQHRKAASAHRHASKLQREEGHEETADYHEAAAKYHEKKSKSETAHASDPVFCRDYAGTPIDASAKWDPDHETKFMHMPAGVHTITAGFRDRAVRLTVDVEPTQTASVLQASFDRLQSSAPKQKPFGCVEHDERDASFWPTRFESGSDGVYLAGEPSALGAEHVNGKIHRSWSPSFTTDADYAHATCSQCHEEGGECACKGSILEFPDGVRGSVSNPARVTGTAFVVGTLTNKPAFRAIAPVKAKEADAVKAAGTSEGAKRGWEHRERQRISFNSGYHDAAHSHEQGWDRPEHHWGFAKQFGETIRLPEDVLDQHFDKHYAHGWLRGLRDARAGNPVHSSSHAYLAHNAANHPLTERALEATEHARRMRGTSEEMAAHHRAEHMHQAAIEHYQSESNLPAVDEHEMLRNYHSAVRGLKERHPNLNLQQTFKASAPSILRAKPQPERPTTATQVLARLRPPPGARQA